LTSISVMRYQACVQHRARWIWNIIIIVYLISCFSIDTDSGISIGSIAATTTSTQGPGPQQPPRPSPADPGLDPTLHPTDSTQSSSSHNQYDTSATEASEQYEKNNGVVLAVAPGPERETQQVKNDESDSDSSSSSSYSLSGRSHESDDVDVASVDESNLTIDTQPPMALSQANSDASIVSAKPANGDSESYENANEHMEQPTNNDFAENLSSTETVVSTPDSEDSGGRTQLNESSNEGATADSHQLSPPPLSRSGGRPTLDPQEPLSDSDVQKASSSPSPQPTIAIIDTKSNQPLDSAPKLDDEPQMAAPQAAPSSTPPSTDSLSDTMDSKADFVPQTNKLNEDDQPQVPDRSTRRRKEPDHAHITPEFPISGSSSSSASSTPSSSSSNPSLSIPRNDQIPRFTPGQELSPTAGPTTFSAVDEENPSSFAEYIVIMGVILAIVYFGRHMLVRWRPGEMNAIARFAQRYIHFKNCTFVHRRYHNRFDTQIIHSLTLSTFPSLSVPLCPSLHLSSSQCVSTNIDRHMRQISQHLPTASQLSQVAADTCRYIFSQRSRGTKSKDEFHQIPETAIEMKSMSTQPFIPRFNPTLYNCPPDPLLPPSAIEQLLPALPFRLKCRNWVLRYASYVDGANLNTFYSKLADQGPSVLVIKDAKNYVFGAFVSQSWTRSENNYFGTGETFVFSILPHFAVYPWSSKNVFFALGKYDCIALGGGNNFAIWLDSTLQRGNSMACETFNNPQLSSQPDFQCYGVEVWGFCS
jgi:TLD